MLRDVTDHANYTLALNYFTFIADFFNRCTYFHISPLRTRHQMRVNISGPLSVIAMVCSKWAERPPSTVITVHLSSRTFTS